MFCRHCGATLKEDAAYCDRCGKATKIEEGVTPPTISQSSPHGGKGSKTLEIILIVCAVAIGLTVVVFAFGGSGSSPTTNETTTPSSSLTATGTSAPLTISSVDPSTVIANYSNLIAVNGNGLQSSTQVTVGGETLAVSGVGTQAQIYVKYKGDLGPGTYSITATNQDGTTFTLSKALTITSAQTTASSAATPTELSSTQITKNISPSVVLIRTDLGCGSGMIVSSDGTILTDDHVISGAQYVDVYLNSGAMYTASVINEDVSQDLALIKIETTGLPTVTFGDSGDTSVALGENVYAFGYPLTCNQNQVLEVEPGIVTARRNISGFGELIQTSARINPGDSGGPFVNSYGKVIGINEAILTVLNIDLNITGVAFAIPSNTITPFVNNPSYYSNTTQPTTYSAPSSPLPSTGSSGSTNPRYFQLDVTGVCTDWGNNGTILLTGYPLTSAYSIPADDIVTWEEGDVAFTVPTVIGPGTYRVAVRGYDQSTGYCPDVNAGSITVQ